jgi:hypothetical protein
MTVIATAVIATTVVTALFPATATPSPLVKA